MEAFPELRRALDEALQAIPPATLSRAVHELSQRYRSEYATGQTRFTRSLDDVVAYAAYRLPATFGALCAVFASTRDRRPDWKPRSLLDVGAGPGAAMWAAVETWTSLEELTLVERDEHMIRFGQRLALHSESSAIRSAWWKQQDVLADWTESERDIVVASYLLGELPTRSREGLVDHLWSLTDDTLVLVEPGTPRGFALVREARDRLRAQGAYTLAPCPHNDACPMRDDDWCHFAQRISRSRVHRTAKRAQLSYEDEKYSYVALSRHPGTPFGARIIRHPQIRPGRISLRLSTPTGLADQTVPRSAGERFRRARDASWGGTWPDHETR